MRTDIGEYLRKLRMSNSQRLKDMAEILGVSSAFLSAVENGKKHMPASWEKTLRKLYNLSEDECEQLRLAAMSSQDKIVMSTKNLSSPEKDLVVTFARQFNQIDEETSNRIKELLKNGRRKKPNG